MLFRLQPTTESRKRSECEIDTMPCSLIRLSFTKTDAVCVCKSTFKKYRSYNHLVFRMLRLNLVNSQHTGCKRPADNNTETSNKNESHLFIGIICNILYKLGSSVLVFILQLDTFSYSYTIFSDLRTSPALF